MKGDNEARLGGGDDEGSTKQGRIQILLSRLQLMTRIVSGDLTLAFFIKINCHRWQLLGVKSVSKEGA